MALDHYVSQVHLNNWLSGRQGSALNVIRKHDLKQFLTSSRDICAIKEGNNNRLLDTPQAIELFLKTVEPKYNRAVADLTCGNFNETSLSVIAGFIGAVLVSSPTALRLHNRTLENMLLNEAMRLESRGEMPKLGGQLFSELVLAGKVQISVDGKFSQTFMAEDLASTANILTQGEWQVLHNRIEGSEFFTSDYPIALEASGSRIYNHKVVPLAPQMALRMIPCLDADRSNSSFTNFKISRRAITKSQAHSINKLIVRSADDILVYLNKQPWIESLVSRNKNFWIDMEADDPKTYVESEPLIRQVLKKLVSRPQHNTEMIGADWLSISPTEDST